MWCKRQRGPAPDVCPKDAGILYVRYDLESIKKDFKVSSLTQGPATMWRYAAVTSRRLTRHPGRRVHPPCSSAGSIPASTSKMKG